MGRKINPTGFRLAVRRDWKSRWFAKGREFAQMVVEDAEIRAMIETDHGSASISRIEIARTSKSAQVTIHSARPGMIIGKKGEGIDRLRARLRAKMGITDLSVDVAEVRQPELNAKLVALNIASQLERRIMFRRAMRRAMGNAQRLGVQGIKIMSSGRLNGQDIARTEWYREGRVPLQTLKNDIDYGFAQAKTKMGVVGIKVWISNGDTVVVSKRAKYSLESDPAADESAAAPDSPPVEASSSPTKESAPLAAEASAPSVDAPAPSADAPASPADAPSSPQTESSAPSPTGENDAAAG